MNASFRSATSQRSEKNNIFNNFDPELPNDDETFSQSSNHSKKASSYQNKNQYNINQQHNNYNQQGQWRNQERAPRTNNNNQNDNYGYRKNNNNWQNGPKFQNNPQGYNKYNNYNNNSGQRQGYGSPHQYGHGTQIQRHQLYDTQKDHFPGVDIKKELGEPDFQVSPVDQSWSSDMNNTKAEAKLFNVNISLIGYDHKETSSSGMGSMINDLSQYMKGLKLKPCFLRGERVYMHNIGDVEINQMRIKPDCAECTIKRFIELDLEKQQFIASKNCKVCYDSTKNTITTSLARVFQTSEDQAIFAKISTSGTKDIKIEDIEKVVLSIQCADCGKKYPVEVPLEKDKSKSKVPKKEEAKAGSKQNEKEKERKKLRLREEKPVEEEKHDENDHGEASEEDDFIISSNIACSTWNCYNLLIFEVKRFKISSQDLKPAKDEVPPPRDEEPSS